MRKIFLLLAIFIIAGTASAETSNSASESENTNAEAGPAPKIANNGQSFKNFSIFLDFGEKYMVSGSWYNSLHNGLTPTPTSLSSLGSGVGFDLYLTKLFGISLAYDYLDMLFANAPNVTSLDVSTCSSIKAQVLMRIPFFQRDNKAMFFRIFAGPNYSFFDATSDLKNLITSSANKSGYTVTFYNGPATGIGFSGGAGYMFEINHLDLGVDFIVDYKNVEYPAATTSIDMLEVGLQFRIGLDF
ncbi:MAG: hypothetical protein ABSG94_07315 [Brevinematales bacterium]|jgi:hypothetical protein